jgi:hypothetical protein
MPPKCEFEDAGIPGLAEATADWFFPLIEQTTGHGGIIMSGILQFVDLMHNGPLA